MSQAVVELAKMSFRLSELEFRLAYTLDTEFAVSSVAAKSRKHKTSRFNPQDLLSLHLNAF